MFEVSFHNTERNRQAMLFSISSFFSPQCCCPANEDNVRNVLRSIFASMSDQRVTSIQVLTKGLGHTQAGLQLVYTGICCENSGSVLRWCSKRSSDPCPRLVSQ